MHEEFDDIDQLLRQRVNEAQDPVPNNEHWEKMVHLIDAKDRLELTELVAVDELLRSRVEETPVNMREEDWKKMSALLDEEADRKKKPFPWRRGLSVLLLLLSTGIGAYIITKVKTIGGDKKESASIASISTPAGVSIPIATSTNTDSHDSAATEQGISYLPNESHIDKVSPPVKSTANSTDKISNNTEAVSYTTIPIGSNKPKLNTPTGNPKSVTMMDTFTTSGTNNTNNEPSINQNPISHANNLSGFSTTAKNNKKTSSKDKKNVESTISKSSPIVKAKEVSKTDSGIQNQRNTFVKDEKLYTQTSRTVSYEKPKEIDQSVYNPRYNAALKNYIPERIDSTIILTYMPTKAEPTRSLTASRDSVTVASADSSTQTNSLFRKRIILFTQLGIQLNKGLKGNIDNPTSWGISPYIGFGLQRPINRNLSLSAALGFNYYNGLNVIQQNNYYSYSFGIDSTQVSYTPKRLYQLNIPFSLLYNISTKHSIQAGFGLSYSLQSSGVIKEDYYINKAVNTLSTPTAAKTTINPVTQISEGFKRFDFFLQAGYSYKVNQRLWLLTMYQQGFLDITDNNVYTNKVHHSLKRISVGIKYNFGKHVQ